MSAERRPLLRGTARSSVRLWLQKIRDCLADIPRLHLSVSWVHGSLPPKRSQPGNESIPDKISRWIASVAPGAGYSVTISDVQRRIVWVNDSFTRMTGYTLSEFRNRKFSEVLYFEGTDAQTVKHVREAFAGGRAVCFELLVRGKDGQQWWLYTDAQPLLDSAGVLEGWVCIQADVTAQVRIREAARAAEIALKLSEAKFRSLFDHSTVAFAMTDVSTGQFLEANRAFAMCTGYTREELLQMTFWDLTTAEGMPSTAKQIENIKGTRQYGPFEKAYRRKDGSHVPVLINGVPLTDAAGRDFMWTVVQDISNLKSMEAELIRAARHDKLTGLANRALFMQRLQEALDRVRSSQQRLFAVLFLDFDRFKLVNDTLGHSAGDELLRQISGRLRGALRSTDACCNDSNGNLVARMGGDEFLILINDLRAPKDAGRIAERLLETLASAYDIFGAPVHSTASIGIVTSDQCEQDAGAVVRNADVAMYEAKRAGRACSVVFSEAMHQRVTRYAMIETSLRQAIGTPDFYLAYQPIVELDTGRMVSVEALARWDHPKFGSIAPSEFIPIAEESGLIIAVGEWVLRQACQAMRGWMTQDPARAPMIDERECLPRGAGTWPHVRRAGDQYS
jgi:diguanylate cyclase (GGDEF)-like protein/PAS domain S-box-containing protein